MKKAKICVPGRRDVQVYVTPGLTVAGLLGQLDLPVHSHGLARRGTPKRPLSSETKVEEALRGSITGANTFDVVRLRSDVASALRATPLPFSSGRATPVSESLHAVVSRRALGDGVAEVSCAEVQEGRQRRTRSEAL